MAYTNEQIKSYADGMLGSGKSWQDVWNTAQQKGVGLEQLAGSYGMGVPQAKQWASQNGVNLFDTINLGTLRPQGTVEEGYGGQELYDAANQRQYAPTWSYSQGADGEQVGNITGYRGYNWTPDMYSNIEGLNGTSYDSYDAQGNRTGSGVWQDLGGNELEDIAKAAAIMGTVYFGGSALAGAGGGQVAGDAFLPGALGPGGSEVAFGSVIPGLEGSVLPLTSAGLETLAPVSQMPVPPPLELSTIPTSSLSPASTLLKSAGAVSSVAKLLGVGSDVAEKLLGNVGLKDIVNLLGGGLDTHNQNRYADKMLNYLSGQQSKIDQYYNPDSPEYKQLWQEMSRKDAAAGRNSQYGVRTTDFMGKVAKDRSDAQIRFMNAGGKLMETALGQKASAPTGLMSALDKITRSSGYSLKDVVRYLSDNGVQLTSVDTDYMNGNLTDEQYRAAASAAQLDTDPEANGAITDILGEGFDLNELWEY